MSVLVTFIGQTSPLHGLAEHTFWLQDLHEKQGLMQGGENLGPQEPLLCLELLAETPITLLCPIRCQITHTSSSPWGSELIWDLFDDRVILPSIPSPAEISHKC